MAPPLTRKTAQIALKGDGTARIVVVADTHSQPHARTAEHIAALAPDAILHAGDIGDLSVLDDLRAIAPLHAVRGNIDTRAHELPDVLSLELEGGGRALRMLMTHIAVYGPKIRADVAKLARADKAQLIVCGHSHVPFIGVDKGLTVFNPGSIGPRRFHLPIVFGTITITPTGVKLAHVNCETGGAWSPP
ncbi:MAG: metallophosphoesterase family protein [Polyangiales bacterium]